jgi:predicted Rossmann fold nucleotide-binding protein DprA/Smf involved in DNA uptake
MTIAQDLKALNKNIQALGKTLDSLLKAVEKDEKPKAKPTKKILAKKAPAKKASAKKAPAKKKAAQPTATDAILKIIKASKKGVDAPTLVKKTGFNQKKVRNILFRTYKQGKIKRIDKGIYTGV